MQRKHILQEQSILDKRVPDLSKFSHSCNIMFQGISQEKNGKFAAKIQL